MTARSARTLLLCLALASVATPALAAPRAVCHLVTDASGDVVARPTRPDDPALDILSADLATTADWVLVAFRVRRLGVRPATTDDASGALHRELSLSFRAQPWAYQVSFRRDSNGDTANAFGLLPNDGSQQPRTGDGIVTVDERRGIVTIVFDRVRLLGADTKQTFTDLRVRSGSRLDTGSSADLAGGPATYHDGAASCLRAPAH